MRKAPLRQSALSNRSWERSTVGKMLRHCILSIVLFALASGSTLLSGCMNLPNGWMATASNQSHIQTGTLKVNLNGDFSKLRSIQFHISDVSTASIAVTGTNYSNTRSIGGADLAKGGESASATFTEIPSGTASVTVIDYDADRNIVGSVFFTTTILPGQTSTMTLSPQFEGVDGNSIIQTVAGTGESGYSGDGRPATSAALFSPSGIAADSAGNLYIADSENNRVRRVSPNGVITTIAGCGTDGYSGDGGPATAAKLYFPSDVAVDSAGNLYIADSENNRVRMVSPDGVITTIAGCGTEGYSGDGGPATAAALNKPSGLAVDSVGNLYVLDTKNNRVRKVSPNGVITTVAGGGTAASGDGSDATATNLYRPVGLAVDSAGNLYIADDGKNHVLKVRPNGVTTAIVWYGTIGNMGDATLADFYFPVGLAVDFAGNLYVSDTYNRCILKVSPNGDSTTIAPWYKTDWWYSGDGGPAIAAGFSSPVDLAVNSAGTLYIADRYKNCIRKVSR